ncbi:MAG: dicarboxylate/amino acid:cation symporter [Planctomycetota bacterium]|nr:dicarboxylate/amino acid:cation symporter [Planctomycetota bacterium]
MADTRTKIKKLGGLAGLMAIVMGIVLGGLLGYFYGKPMWLAGGGPAELLERLEATRQQKEEFAAEVAESDPDEAARLRGHIPQIDARIQEVQNEQQQAAQASSLLAYALWEFTKFCGELFLQVLKLLVIPLVMTSMICGITALGDVRNLGKIGGWTLIYYMTTAGAAVLLGIVLVQIIQPGVDADDTFAFVTENVMEKEGTDTLQTLLNVFRGQEGKPHTGMFPGNIFLAASHTNVLALIVFALVFGAALTTIGDKGKVAIDFFQAANLAVMKMVHIVMWFAPVGIFGLVAFNIAKKGGGAAFGSQVAQLSKYVFTVSLGLLLHSILLTIVLWAFTRRNPLRYLYGVTRALLTAATTASSSATLPISMECVEENNNVSNKTASFVLPLGATINMDGTALYEAVAVIFIAQSIGFQLTLGALVVIFLTATLAAVGAAGIPEAGLVTMVIVLTAVGLPISGIGIILAIDWFLDRLRTTVNVYGDTIGAGVIDHYVQHEM